MIDPAVIAAVVGGLVGGASSLLVMTASEVVKHVTRNHEEHKRNQHVRLMVRALYRNAFKVLDVTMRLGYLDQPKRFETTLVLLVDRVKRDDIAEAFEPAQADIIITSITALLDGLHGCLSAHEQYIVAGSPKDNNAVEQYAESVRENASVALALTGLVLGDIGEKNYLKNLSRVNANRIVSYMTAERERVKLEEMRDEANVARLERKGGTK